MHATTRRTILLLCACGTVLLLSGCITPVGSKYRHHVNLTVAPVEHADPALATAPPVEPAAIAAAAGQ